ncbi:MAG: hypothetical protein KAT41_05310 [Candidatus Marinimicrobia bacterium]|nr:hypothetical protein [Candidatus Neomarinimicrobiota bacterium]
MDYKRVFFIVGIILIFSLLLLAQDIEEKTIYLKSGGKVTGKIISTDPETGDIEIQTAYGVLEIKGEDILQEVVSIILKSGDRLKGLIIYEDNEKIHFQSDYGLLKINKGDIEQIDYELKKGEEKVSKIEGKFSLGKERQIDVFYDPTGYVLDKGTLYVSGLSWGFGITNRLQITSKWSGYFLGDFNIRPKIQIFRKGSWEKEHALSIGGHIHMRYIPDKYEWTEKTFQFEKGHYNDSQNWIKTKPDSTIDLYYGEYLRIGSKLELEEGERLYNDYWDNIESGWVDIDEPDNSQYYEVFAAYTFSRARKGKTGRMSHTLGAYLSKFSKSDDFMYKIYLGGAVDIRKNIIFNYEIYYDPWYVEWWKRTGIFYYEEDELSKTKPKKEYVSPFHFDMGFIYAYRDWLRFGIHFQPYIFAIYMKF